MYIVQILVTLLVGYLVGYLQENQRLKKKRTRMLK